MTNPSPLLLGVDIGTTTLSLIVLDTAGGHVISRQTLPNGGIQAGLQGIQHAHRIADQTLDAVAALCDAYPGIASIGVTGQMHGVLCLSGAGEAVSPLYTWQCTLADEPLCNAIAQKTGHAVHPGYGHATLHALAQSGCLPQNAQQYCTIMDYIVMRLTGRQTPLMHAANAASLGLWDLAGARFDEAAVRSLIPLRAPQTTAESLAAGTYRGIPVSVAIGDNQASFFGSVRDEARSLLLNYGTGSQLSFVCASADTPGGEIRPYIGNQYLLCRSALCGGRAYAMLERFFAAFAVQAGYSEAAHYETLNALAAQAQRDTRRLQVSTLFCGTREDPGLRGSIAGIGEDNFTPGALALGVLQGMADELHSGFDAAAHPHITCAVASGNAVRKNPVLRRVLGDTFSMPLSLPIQQEEAALGAALFGGMCAGMLTYPQAKAFIRLDEAD
ncbi:MAG: hypothetical protein IKU38_04025 [Clostridia bacterium]|nr:hypothetical protein [Clostridia bacterium]